MAWGTLLGYVREGALMKHDKDIDVGLLAEDWPKRSALIEEMERRGYMLEFNDSYKMRFIRRDRITHLDVDVFFPWNGRMICIHMTDDGWHAGAWFPRDAFDNFRRVIFCGREMLIPEPPETVLETIYGDWRTPVVAYSSVDIPNRLHLPEGAEKPCLPM